MALLIGSAACGSSESPVAESASTPSTTPTTSTTTAATTAAGEQTPAFIDIESCDNAGGNGTASGTIENQGTTATAYHLELGFYDSATNALIVTGAVDTASVQPGDSVNLGVNVSGLAGVEVACHTVGLTAVAGGSGPATSTTGPAVKPGFPCDLVPQAEIEQIAGNALDPGDAQTNHVTEDDATWTEHECAWLKFGAEAATEARLGVSRAADFPSGSIECPPLASSTAVSGLGNQAQWAWSDPGTTVTVGTLRVCSDAALVQVTVTGATSGDSHLDMARKVAETALASL